VSRTECVAPLFLAAALSAFAEPFDEFVTLDDDTKHFRNADGLFCGFGVNYCQRLDGKMGHAPSRFDLAVMESDLRQIRRIGFTHVVLRMNWGLLSRKETKAGALVHWKKVLDLVEQHGLYAQIWFDPLNSWPAEVQAKHRRQTIFRDRNWRLYLDWVAETVGRFKGRKCILAWRSENESLPVDTATRHANDPELRTHFVNALKAHYRTVEHVNKAWGTAYAGFDSVKLPGKEHDLPDSAQLIDYNVLFHEPFIIERNQELARVIRKHDPNHLLFVSGIGAVGGRVGFLFEVHDVDKLTGFDVCGNGLYGRFHPQGTGSLLHYARTVRKFLSLGKPAMITEVGTEIGKHGRTYQRDWILAHFADAVGAGATAMDIWAYTSITDEDGNFRSTDNSTCHGLGEFIRSVQGTVFPQEQPQVLILKTKAEDYGRWPWRCHGNAMMLGDFLYQMHVPYDVMTDANITPERLDRYSFVFVPSRSVLLAEPVWQMIDGWVRGKPNRGLAVGYFSPRSAALQPTTPRTMAKLMGFDPGAPHSVVGVKDVQTLAFHFERPFGPFRAQGELELRFGGAGVLWNMPRQWADSAQIVATLRHTEAANMPLLVENRLANGSRVYSLAMRLGLVSWSLSMGMLQPTFDNLVPLYAEMLRRSGVTPRYAAPHNLGVYISKDNDAVIVKERMGIATRELLRSDRLGSFLYQGATVSLRRGRPPALLGPLRPRGVRVFRRVPIRVTKSSGEVGATALEHSRSAVHVKVESEGTTVLMIDGLEPNADFQLTSVEAPSRRLRATTLDSDQQGQIVLTVEPSDGTYVRLEFHKKRE